MLRCLATTVVLLTVATSAQAQETPAQNPVPPDDTVKRNEVVIVTASKVQSTIVNAPATVSVVDTDAIETGPSQTYGDLLRGVPGLNVIQMSARDFNVTARQATGTVATSQLALVDGRSIYLDFFGVILWDTVPVQISDIKQIEVVRGPASAVWGANALTGVVNIITKTPRESAGMFVTFAGGTFDRDAGSGVGRRAGYTWGTNATMARAPNPQWSYRISAGYFDSDPFPRPSGSIPRIADPRDPRQFVGGAPYPIDGPAASGVAAFENQGTRQPKFDVRVDQELDSGGGVSYTAGIAGSTGIVHTGIGPFKVSGDSYFSYARAAYAKGAFKLAGFTNIVDAKAPSLLAVDPFTNQAVQLNFKTQTYDLDLTHSKVLRSRHILSYGGNARRNNFEITLAPNGRDRNEFGVYLQDEIFFDKLRFNVGGRVDKFGNLADPVFSPRISAMFKPTSAHSFRASFNRAFRSPSVVNNYLDQAIVNPVDLSALAPLLPPAIGAALRQPFPLVVRAVGSVDLKEESLSAYEVGYTGSFFGRTTVSLALYINDTDDSINFVTLPTNQDPYTPANPPPFWTQLRLPPQLLGLLAQQGLFLPRTAFQYLNLGPIRNRGFEASLDHVFPGGVSGSVNYSWQDEPEVLDDPNPFPTDEIALPPRHRLSARLSVVRGHYLANLTLNHVSKAFWSDVLTAQYHGFTDAYTPVNLSLGRKWAGERVTTTLRVTNLLNDDVQQHVFGDILKRSITADVRLKF
jgi:iron complex outermembrane receptor protein